MLSILLHGFETWTLTKNMESKLKAFEMHGNGWMLRNIKPMNKFCRWQIQQGRYYQQQRKEKKGRKDGGNPELPGRKQKKSKNG